MEKIRNITELIRNVMDNEVEFVDINEHFSGFPQSLAHHPYIEVPGVTFSSAGSSEGSGHGTNEHIDSHYTNGLVDFLTPVCIFCYIIIFICFEKLKS